MELRVQHARFTSPLGGPNKGAQAATRGGGAPNARLVRASKQAHATSRSASPDCATMRNPGYKDRHAPGVEASSGLALLCNDAHRSGRRTSPRRQPGVILFRYRQDIRFANTTCNADCGMPMSFGGTHASKHSSAARRTRAITNSTLRPRPNGQHIGSAATEAACVLRLKSARPGSKCSRAPSCTRCRPRSTWIGSRACRTMPSGTSVFRRCSKKRAAANHIGLLRTRQASRISIIPFASRTKFLQRSKHEVWH